MLYIKSATIKEYTNRYINGVPHALKNPTFNVGHIVHVRTLVRLFILNNIK